MRQEEQVPRPQMDPFQLLARSQYTELVALLLSKDPSLQGQDQFDVAVPDDYSSSPSPPPRTDWNSDYVGGQSSGFQNCLQVELW